MIFAMFSAQNVLPGLSIMRGGRVAIHPEGVARYAAIYDIETIVALVAQSQFTVIR